MTSLSAIIPEFIEETNLPCSTVSPEIFFSEDIEDENGKVVQSVYRYEGEAKTLCVSCPVRVQCLTSALKTNAIGIWGGTTEIERKDIKRRRKDPANVRVKMTGKRSKRS